ncbi:MAG: YneF family protein [Bacilli bacterium]
MEWIPFLLDLVKVIGGLIVGGIAGFFIARNYMKKYMKKNPPINEQMIKTMMTQMGRTPSQKQVNQMMKAMSKQME